MDMKELIEEIEYMYKHNDGDNGYAVTDTFFNGYEAALLDVLAILEDTDVPSVVKDLAYLDMDEVEESFICGVEFNYYKRKLDSLSSMIDDNEMKVLIDYWYDDCQIADKTLHCLYGYVREKYAKETQKC